MVTTSPTGLFTYRPWNLFAYLLTYSPTNFLTYSLTHLPTLLAAFLVWPVAIAGAQSNGIWTSPAELRAKPMSGPAWQAVWKAANEDMSRPSIADQMNPTNVRALAAAIVWARTDILLYRKKVISAIEKLVSQGRPQGSTLAWARRSGAYVLAADLVGYRSVDFEVWLHSIADDWHAKDGRTLREMFHRRPNNWGTHAFGALTAIYCYLDDRDELRATREYWIQGVTGANPGYKFGRDRSWHADPRNPRLINPVGSLKNGISLDGLLPDDMRRGGPLQNPPLYTNYVWEAQQGLVMAARILDRFGWSIWDVGDKAIYRAAHALQERMAVEWKAKGDDLWMLAFYDDAYGTNWSQQQDVWGAGKNVGWAYVVWGQTPELFHSGKLGVTKSAGTR